MWKCVCSNVDTGESGHQQSVALSAIHQLWAGIMCKTCEPCGYMYDACTKYIIHVCNTCKVHVRCIERNPSDVSGYHVQATTCSCFITTPVSISIWQPLALRISGYQDIRPGKYEEIGGMRLWGYQTIMRSGDYEKIMKWREGPIGFKMAQKSKIGPNKYIGKLGRICGSERYP